MLLQLLIFDGKYFAGPKGLLFLEPSPENHTTEFRCGKESETVAEIISFYLKVYVLFLRKFYHSKSLI